MQPKYAVYATLLDAFAWYKKSEDEKALQEFLDKVNRVPTPKTEAQLRGTAFNALVDAVAMNAPHERFAAIEGITIGREGWEIYGKPCPDRIVQDFANRFRGALAQFYVETVLETRMGPVKVYGFLDEILGDTAWEIKTTERYEFPKFLHNWQHPTYLECLRAMGADVKRFTYLATDFREVYEEEYLYRPEDTERLVSECTHLIEFLEGMRPQITDGRVFARTVDKVTR